MLILLLAPFRAATPCPPRHTHQHRPCGCGCVDIDKCSPEPTCTRFSSNRARQNQRSRADNTFKCNFRVIWGSYSRLCIFLYSSGSYYSPSGNAGMAGDAAPRPQPKKQHHIATSRDSPGSEVCPNRPLQLTTVVSRMRRTLAVFCPPKVTQIYFNRFHE